VRAASERGVDRRRSFQRRIAAAVLDRAGRRAAQGVQAARAGNRRRSDTIDRTAAAALRGRREALRRAAVALRAHDPERTLERGYALAEDGGGEPVTSAAAAVAAGRVRLRFADGRVGARIDRRDDHPPAADAGGSEQGLRRS
jgi:exodeoxyribonuclease VII large subunit